MNNNDRVVPELPQTKSSIILLIPIIPQSIPTINVLKEIIKNNNFLKKVRNENKEHQYILKIPTLVGSVP